MFRKLINIFKKDRKQSWFVSYQFTRPGVNMPGMGDTVLDLSEGLQPSMVVTIKQHITNDINEILKREIHDTEEHERVTPDRVNLICLTRLT